MSFAARLRRLEFRLSSEWQKCTRRPLKTWPSAALLSYIAEHRVAGSEDHIAEFLGRLSDDQLRQLQKVLRTSIDGAGATQSF